jgi:hypothetical protein
MASMISPCLTSGGVLSNICPSDSGIITPSLALKSFLTYFGTPDPALKGAIVSMYQAGGMCCGIRWSTLKRALEQLTT